MLIGSKYRIACAVFLLSLLVRVVWAGLAQVTPISDFRGYDTLAWRWISTGEFGWVGRTAYRTPGYPGLLALIYLAVGHSWKAAAVFQALLGALTSGMLVLLAANVLSVRASAVAGLLHTFSPAALAYVPILASENLAVPLVVAGLLCLAVADRRTGVIRYAAVAGSGVILGLLLLVRPVGVFMFPAPFFLAAYSPRKRAWRFVPAFVFLGAAAVVLAPWLVRNHRVGLGATTLSTTGGINAWMGNNDAAIGGGYCKPAQSALDLSDLGEKERDAAYRATALTWIRAHPRRYLALCGTRALRLLGAKPDGWAAKYLVPTRENDAALTGQRQHRRGKHSVSPSLLSRARAVESRNLLCLAAFRAVIAPLMVLALSLSLLRWRSYAIVVLPALCYLGGISLVYAQLRFRHLAEPLLFVPLAALLADVFFGASELGSGPSRGVKVAIAVLLVVASVLLHASGVALTWYRLEVAG